MPIYEYRCEACGHDFEKLVKLSAPIPSCPECDANSVKKRVSAAAFVLKGGGWYKDHYGLKTGATTREGSGGDSKPTGTGADSTTSASTTSDAKSTSSPSSDSASSSPSESKSVPSKPTSTS